MGQASMLATAYRARTYDLQRVMKASHAPSPCNDGLGLPVCVAGLILADIAEWQRESQVRPAGLLLRSDGLWRMELLPGGSF